MTPPAQSRPTLRVLTYNVRSLRDDALAVARVIRSARPDVVCVQEAPRLWRWQAKCAALARRSGLVVVTGGRPAGGNLILSSLGVEVLAHRDVLLAAEPGLPPRGAALAELRWRDQPFVLGATHLDLEPHARLRHAEQLERELADFGSAGGPSVVAGDINDIPGSPPWQRLAQRRADAFAAAGTGDGYTYSAVNPARRIDAIFVGAPITVVSAAVLDGPDVMQGSDHRPVLAELAFGSNP